MDKVIAVDLDGTLAEYNGWRGMEHIGAPVQNIVTALKYHQSQGAKIWIFTARVSDDNEAPQATFHIKNWLKRYNIEVDGITAVKHKFFTEIWDDRAIQVVRNTGQFILNENSNLPEQPVDDHGLTIPEPVFTPECNEAIEDEEAPEDPMAIQIGGNHYKKWKIQPLDFSFANNMPFLEANVLKYICRHADKNGIQDLRKAKHYLEIMASKYYNETL